MAYRVEFRTETYRAHPRPTGRIAPRDAAAGRGFLPAAPVEFAVSPPNTGYAFPHAAAPGGVPTARTRPLLVPRRPHGRPAARGDRPLAPSRHRGRRGVLCRDPAVRRDRRRGAVRAGPVSDGRPELQTRHGSVLQANKDIVNPYLVSTRGFGLLWDNYSASEFRDGGRRFRIYRRKWATPSITGSSTEAIPPDACAGYGR